MSAKEETQTLPEWAAWKRLDEKKFCEDFLFLQPMIWTDGSFFDEEGAISDGVVRQRIYSMISPYVCTDIARKTGALLEALRLRCAVEELPLNTGVIPCQNGDYYVRKDELILEKGVCRHRLPVNYNPYAQPPKRWLAFLEELLEPQDIETLQQFIGYCLIPSNAAQKMLLIIGNGGEGKSRIGVVLSALLGQSMVNGSLGKVESSPFARADLQNRLLMVDDDLALGALKSTNYIKTLVTADQPLDVERKGLQSYQARLYCRFLGFGNGNLKALYDRSHGFFRRQIILTTKPLDPKRVDDPFLAQRIIREELEGVLMWAVTGLFLLLGQDMRFTISPRARENMNTAMREGNSIPDFLASTGYLRFQSDGMITSRHLYSLYRDWCTDNEEAPVNSKSFSSWVIQNKGKYGLTYSNGIPGGNGRLVRGFRGVRSVV